MKKSLVVLVALAMLLSAIACAAPTAVQSAPAAEAAPATESAAAPAAEPDNVQSGDAGLTAGNPVNFTIATTSLTAGTNQDQHMREIAATLAEKTGGRFTATIIDASMQGNSREAVTSLQNGTFDLLICCDMEVDMVIDSLAWAWTPFLVTNYEQADDYYYNGWIADKLTECMAASGIVKVGNAENGNRVCGTVATPITKLSDFKGVKVRTPEIAGVVEFYTRCGATAVSISTSEVAMAMQQGMCDGVDNSIQNINNTGVLSMCKYVTKTNHMYAGASVIANKDFWDGLSAEDQALVREVAKAAGDKYIPLYRAEEEKLFQTEGMTVIEPDKELMADFYEIGEQIWKDSRSKYSEDIAKLVDEQLAKNIAAFNG